MTHQQYSKKERKFLLFLEKTIISGGDIIRIYKLFAQEKLVF